MKKKILCATLFGTLLFLTSCPIEFGKRSKLGTENETAITWVDSAIGSVIATQLHKPINAIFPSDVAGITNLHLSNKNITKLDDFEHFPSLTSLILSKNKNISDLNPLTKLANLTSLDLSGNQMGNLTLLNELDNQIALANLTNLISLNLSDNQIKDVTSLATLTKLANLDLRDNQIRDLNPLVTLTKLSNLDLRGNPITKWTPVAHVPIVKGRPPEIT